MFQSNQKNEIYFLYEGIKEEFCIEDFLVPRIFGFIVNFFTIFNLSLYLQLFRSIVLFSNIEYRIKKTKSLFYIKV